MGRRVPVSSGVDARTSRYTSVFVYLSFSLKAMDASFGNCAVNINAVNHVDPPLPPQRKNEPNENYDWFSVTSNFLCSNQMWIIAASCSGLGHQPHRGVRSCCPSLGGTWADEGFNLQIRTTCVSAHRSVFHKRVLRTFKGIHSDKKSRTAGNLFK